MKAEGFQHPSTGPGDRVNAESPDSRDRDGSRISLLLLPAISLQSAVQLRVCKNTSPQNLMEAPSPLKSSSELMHKSRVGFFWTARQCSKGQRTDAGQSSRL